LWTPCSLWAALCRCLIQSVLCSCTGNISYNFQLFSVHLWLQNERCLLLIIWIELWLRTTQGQRKCNLLNLVWLHIFWFSH
jgi:hypothetical protein